MKRFLFSLFAAVAAIALSTTELPVVDAETFDTKRSVDRHWNTCESLEWKVLASADKGMLRQVTRAMVEFRRASRIDFRFAGMATEAEFASPPLNTLVVGVDPTLTGGRVAGLTALWYVDGASDPRVVSGARISINPRVTSRASTAFPALLPVLLHELGHVAGLDHVDDPADLMYPYIVNVRAYRPRDVTLLRRGTAAAVCPAGARAASQ